MKLEEIMMETILEQIKKRTAEKRIINCYRYSTTAHTRNDCPGEQNAG